MSASSKKKLRKEEALVRLTERQAAEQKEATQLKIYTAIFGVVIGAMLIFALAFGITKTVSNSGIIQRNTVAATVGEHEISSAELNMFYIDAVNTFYSQYGSYAYIFGLDTSKPLNEQVTDEETGTTWADDFMASAEDNLKHVYTMCDLARAEGYTLTEEEQTELDNALLNAEFYALYNYGYTDLETYLKAMYGSGCTEELYRKYQENTALAQSYYNHYSESLTYEDADLREFESDIYNQYSSYTYNYYTLAVDEFLTGGTTDDEGNTTYSDEEQAAAITAAEEAAKSLTAEEIVTVEDLDAAIAGLEINAEAESAASILCTDQAYESVNATIREWLTDSARKEGDLTYIPDTYTSTDEEGNEITTTESYIVVMYQSTNDNKFPLADVRHILVSYEGGTTDENGVTNYSEDEKKAAEAKATDLMEQVKSKGGTAEVFAELAKNNSTDPGSMDNGGLYTDVYPGQMVEAFNDWCFDASRKPGDIGLVQTDYGWHVMFYEGDSETTYRDFLLTQDMKAADTEAWYEAQMEGITLTILNDKHIDKDLILGTA